LTAKPVAAAPAAEETQMLSRAALTRAVAVLTETQSMAAQTRAAVAAM
jgi:hypothetical protein